MYPKSTDTETSLPFRSVDEGRAVEFEEGVWEHAQFMDYHWGYPLYSRNPS